MHVVGYANPNAIELYMFIRLAAIFAASNLVFGSLACLSCVCSLRCNTKKFVGVNHLKLSTSCVKTVLKKCMIHLREGRQYQFKT